MLKTQPSRIVDRVSAWLRARSPRSIVSGGLAIFLIYSWPGFIGWDTREHMLQARSGIYTDSHPPAVAHLIRLVELFVAGPAGMLLIQSVTLIIGLYLVFKSRLSARAAAWAASGVFLFPYISGVTAVIAKDAIMASSLMIAIALLLDDRTSRQRVALLFVVFATMMRWNALAATFAPMILLFRWRPSSTGIRRYAIALVAWFGVTAAAYEANELMTTEHEHLWYGTFAYADIAGTLQYMPDLDDATVEKLFEGVPLRVHDHIQSRFRAIYNPTSYYQLMREATRVLDPPLDAAGRAAVVATWKNTVLAYPSAYLHYRWDHYKLLLALDRPPSFSNVYVWFNVIAFPQAIGELEHDAAPSRLQSVLHRWSIAISLTPLYWPFLYFATALVLLVCARSRLELALLLSALGYQLQWFFIATTTETRYSQWMVLATLVALVLGVSRIRRRPPLADA